MSVVLRSVIFMAPPAPSLEKASRRRIAYNDSGEGSVFSAIPPLWGARIIASTHTHFSFSGAKRPHDPNTPRAGSPGAIFPPAGGLFPAFFRLYRPRATALQRAEGPYRSAQDRDPVRAVVHAALSDRLAALRRALGQRQPPYRLPLEPGGPPPARHLCPGGPRRQAHPPDRCGQNSAHRPPG